MNPNLDYSSALSLLKMSDLELLDFLCIGISEGKGGGKEEGSTCWELNFILRVYARITFLTFFDGIIDGCGIFNMQVDNSFLIYILILIFFFL